jgi:glycosyltransferase involved in cell wall biosynthesis
MGTGMEQVMKSTEPQKEATSDEESMLGMIQTDDSVTVIVIPTYEDAAAQQLIKNLYAEYGTSFYLVAVDDGSIENPVQSSWFESVGAIGCILRLRKNVGHQAAITVGINYALENLSWQRLIVMDSDGEDTPRSSRQLLEVLDHEQSDIVVANRRSRVETLKFKVFYKFYKFVFFLLVGRTISFGNFMAMNREAASRLAASSDTWHHVAASVLNAKLRVTHCAIDRGPRYTGKSKMNFVSLVLHGFRGIMVFFDRVLVRVSIVCILCAVVAVAAMIIIASLKIMGLASPGWFSTLSGILVLILFQVLIVGLLSMFIAGTKRVALVSEFDYKKLIHRVVSVSGKSKVNALKMNKQAPS